MPKVRNEDPELIEAEETKAWICKTCDTMTEPGETYCLHCKMYWEDVSNGLFDDDPFIVTVVAV